MAEIACTAYLHAMSPLNIVSAFRKTGIYPFNQQEIQPEKLFPCETFRKDTPLQKVIAMKTG
ncbi:hypothetical protein DPMN_072756 [Dreissena polymorpha]|uniref:Uncharacterized protein n=1 Tax=Dreissena polymorpha TaxID=45954 RepID=A0A9D4H9X0_DREPO|nr:hypothetical protein DPMN_072756 [Dreissena polymorpha]